VSLSERIQSELLAAMKSKEVLKLSVLRMTKAALRKIELRRPLSPDEESQLLQTLVKQRTESIEMFEKGGRADLAEKEGKERDLLRAYLPEAVSEADVERVVVEVLRDLGASSAKDIGAVMKEALVRLKATGKTVDGKAVNSVVRAKLS